MPKSVGKNVENQQMEPSKAWIKNLGVGTTKRNIKRDRTSIFTNRSATPPQRMTPSPSLSLSPSPPPMLSPLPLFATNTRKNGSMAPSQANVIQLDLSVDKFNETVKMVDNSSVLDETIVQQPATSLELANGSGICDSTNYQTCIDFETTLINAAVSPMPKLIDSKPIVSKATQSKTSTSNTTKNREHFPVGLNAISDETSLYEPKGTIDWMNARIVDQQKLSEELSALKREWNEHFDDTVINDTVYDYDYTLVNRDDDFIPPRAHELSIDLASFDFPSPSKRCDRKLNDTSLSPTLNSTELVSTNTIVQIDKAVHDLRQIGLVKRKFVYVKVKLNKTNYQYFSFQRRSGPIIMPTSLIHIHRSKCHPMLNSKVTRKAATIR